MKKRAINQKLRIKLFYDDSVYRLDSEKFDLINNTILPDAVEFWEAALRVRKTANNIRLSRKCEDNQVFYKTNDSLPYCKNRCEEITMCGEVRVPQEHLDSCRVCDGLGRNCHQVEPPGGKGIEGADFVFYVSAMETERCHKGMTVAYAAHCQQEAALDRPIAGHANLCPSSISTQAQALSTLSSTVKHEILHALGFSVSLFAFFRDKDGNPRTPRTDNGKPLLNEELHTRQWSEAVVQRAVRKQWLVAGGYIEKEINMMVTPRVVEEVRAHFNCPLLEGAELEDQGQEGTALTHWEKRIFENEAMTGTHTQNPVYSRITLALMEDTGWYYPNYEMAQELSWGKGLGCDFAMKSCKEWMDVKLNEGERLYPYCDKVKRDPLQTECSADRTSVALCNLIEHPTPLPLQFQNFDYLPNVAQNALSKYGGSVVLADYCPYVQEFTWKSQNKYVRGSHCLYEENNPVPDLNFALELYGENSVCVEHPPGRQWVERNCLLKRHWEHWGSGCYQYLCYDGHLHLMVENHTFTCFHPGQVIEISLFANDWLHQGAIVCPWCQDICSNEGMVCKRPMAVPRTLEYHKDVLVCGGSSSSPSLGLLISCLALTFLVSMGARTER
ncbi:unnamed protein product [Darwinula stevensoni]|uniref:Leishmanolysin-like peptidase n=1 Tax=Darwinula stevensoni TaxID=69355 RepID=A0A7R8WZV8_9CRUS|nr:unnamed protein product [Darwinula stevensoni]CAG0880548.1 unnamed protein product [Darwinula stevensoni]